MLQMQKYLWHSLLSEGLDSIERVLYLEVEIAAVWHATLRLNCFPK